MIFRCNGKLTTFYSLQGVTQTQLNQEAEKRSKWRYDCWL